MAYTAVPTAVTGQNAWNADYVNTYIGANFAAGVPDIFTTKGDLAVGTGVNAASRLAVQTDGYLLTADSARSTGMYWALDGVFDLAAAKGDLVVGTAADTMAALTVGANNANLQAASGEATGIKWSPVVTCSGTGGEAISVGEETVAVISSQTWDVGSILAGSGDTITIGTGQGGYYLVMANVSFNKTAAWTVNDQGYVRLKINATNTIFLGTQYVQAAQDVNLYIGGAGIVSLDDADVMDFILYINTGGGFSVSYTVAIYMFRLSGNL